jgi:hypothetical protein
MSYPWRLAGGAGILLAIGAAHLGLPVWVTAIGAALCIVFVLAFVRAMFIG